MENREQNTVTEGASSQLPPKLRQLLGSRKAWAGVLGMAMTVGLWAVGEIDGARAVEALTWVVGIFIGAVALEDGMTRFFHALGAGAKEVSQE